MAFNIIIALISGLVSSFGMYLLCTEKERKDYAAYDKQLQILRTEAETAIRRADAAVGFLKIMNNTIKQNRDDLDVLVPEFTKLKQWSYYYVQYMPRKEHHALEKKDVASPSVQG